ncbi:hypothetical protein, partial [Shinella pollutisoli]
RFSFFSIFNCQITNDTKSSFKASEPNSASQPGRSPVPDRHPFQETHERADQPPEATPPSRWPPYRMRNEEQSTGDMTFF